VANTLRFEVVPNTERPTLTAEPAFFDAAKRRLGRRQQDFVDPDHAAFEASGLPVSVLMTRAMFSFRSRMRSAARRRILARSQAGIRRHTAKPRAALARTASASSVPPAGIVPFGSSVTGELTVVVLPEIAWRQTLSISMPKASYIRGAPQIAVSR
jgi:hypothetical protein